MSYVYRSVPTPQHPPSTWPKRVVCGEWWGCSEWMVKATPPRRAEPRAVSIEQLPALAAGRAGAGAERIELGVTRFAVDPDGDQHEPALVRVVGDYAVLLPLIAYVEAIVQPTAWELTPFTFKRGVNAHLLVGLIKGEPVGVIAPIHNWKEAVL